MKRRARILGFWPGILVFFFAVGSQIHAENSLDLPSELFDEHDWISCRREALRESSVEPRSERGAFLAAAAKLRLSHDATSQATLKRLAEEAADLNLRARAAYELGYWFEKQKQLKDAAKWFEKALLLQGGAEIGARAMRALNRILQVDDSVLPTDSPVRLQIATLSPTWTAERKEMDESTPRKTPRTAGFELWIVRFYRSQIRPAIGARCSLEPSCSEYFARAAHQHGILAFPIMADRSIREPSVVQAWEHPVEVHGRERCEDRVEWHTYWFTGKDELP